MAYELDRQDILRFSDTIQGQKKEKGDELTFEHCPYCGSNSNDRYKFSVNLKTGAFQCFRASCGKAGHFVELARDFGYTLDFKDGKGDKVYKQLPQTEIVVRSAAVKYLETRGISQKTTEHYKITTQKANESIIVFPFFNEKNVLEFVKYRNASFKKGDPGNKEWCESNTRPILFGMMQCNPEHGPLIITEGQMDSLTLSECGIPNATSVPTGALGFTWIDHIWDWLTQFSEVIVFGDNEKGKMTLIDTLEKRLPARVKGVRICDYLGEKDANAIYQKYGQGAIINAIGNAGIVPVANVVDLSDVQRVNDHDRPKIKTNIHDIDKILKGGFRLGELVLLTGRCGDGKSTFMSQLMLEAIEQGYNAFAYSGELANYQFKQWFDLQCAGPMNLESFTNEWGDEIYFVSDAVGEKISKWYNGKAFIYDNQRIEGVESDYLIKTIEKMIMRYDTKFICIDNLMTAIDVGMDGEIYSAQSKFVEKLKNIAEKREVVIILVAHPRKTQNEISNDDVSGSSDVTKRVDVSMSYSRESNEEAPNDSILHIMKSRVGAGTATGKNGLKLFYSNSSKRISGMSGNSRAYGWEK